VVQWVVWSAADLGVPRSTPEKVHAELSKFWLFILENNRKCKCVLKVEAIFEMRHFSKKKQISSPSRGLEPGTSVVATGRPANWAFVISCLLVYSGNVLSTWFICNPWWIFSPCNMYMCTNKTCFAGVGTWPKPISRIRISCLSCPCEFKKI